MTAQTRVTFYEVPHRGRFLHQLLETKILPQQMTALVYTGSVDETAKLDEFLWTCKQESFLPHARVGDGWAESTPVLVASEPPSPGTTADVLVDWSATVPDFCRDFPRLVDIVSADPESVARANERQEKYRGMGLQVDAHKIGARKVG